MFVVIVQKSYIYIYDDDIANDNTINDNTIGYDNDHGKFLLLLWKRSIS